eukprot:TRINITY_DN3757_c0_g1_i1.p1 TRINITY_DN3757_c0_g1~~TRINITY_DN3757_c0_g1_i1.p1  ORF type:complete len:186 (+),score=28.35 TRINITY_DN3757_c0_g1_i1:55-612(+)
MYRPPSFSAGSDARLSLGFSDELNKQVKEVFDHIPPVSDARNGERKVDDRKLRACMHCKLLKTEDQFLKQGCSNCPSIVKQGDRESVDQYTTLNFEGMVCVCTGNRDDSWVCRWQDLDHPELVPGAYAVAVRAFLETEVEDNDDSYDGTESEEEDAQTDLASVAANTDVKSEIVKSEIVKSEIQD